VEESIDREVRRMDFINLSTIEIAKALLGKKLLIHQGDKLIGGYIVETEAYLGPKDEACHSYHWKKTPKVKSMYQPGGTIYIYSMHGHNMLNIVTKEMGQPEAILIRGIQPTDHEDVMLDHRPVTGFNLSNGPGKLTKAMGITRELDGWPINESSLLLDEAGSQTPKEIATSPRIGIPNKGKWTDEPLRFYVAGNPYVSRMPKRLMKEADDTWK